MQIISFPVGCQFANGLCGTTYRNTNRERTTLRVGTVRTYSDSQYALREAGDSNLALAWMGIMV
jgi:hypothetical protein